MASDQRIDPVENLDSSAPIWRYLDIPKLLHVLTARTLYLTQLARLEDPFEGALPNGFAKWIEGSGAFESPMADVEGRQIGAFQLARYTCYVSCWCRQEHESHALWRIYGGQAGGVAIKSSVGRLAKYCARSDRLGPVRYIDFERDTYTDLNVIGPAFVRPNFFHYEQEVRLVRWVMHADEYPRYCKALATPDIPALIAKLAKLGPGVEVPINPEELIEEIVVSPFAPRWHFQTVLGLLENLGADIKLRLSDMAAQPNYHFVK